MFLISNKLEQLEFKLKKLLGFRNMQEKLKNIVWERISCYIGHHETVYCKEGQTPFDCYADE